MDDRKKRLTARLEALHHQTREEQTVSGNAGAFAVPLGGVQRDVFPNTVTGKKRKKQKDEDLVQRAAVQLERLRSR